MPMPSATACLARIDSRIIQRVTLAALAPTAIRILNILKPGDGLSHFCALHIEFDSVKSAEYAFDSRGMPP